MKHALVIVCVLLLVSHVAYAKPASDSVTAPRYDGLYMGLQIGAPAVLGLHVRYVGTIASEPAYYLVGDAAVGFWSGVSIGGGVVLWRNVNLGVRGHFGSNFEEQYVCFNRKITADIAWTIPLSSTRGWLMTIDASPGIEFNSCPTPTTDDYQFAGGFRIGFMFRIF